MSFARSYRGVFSKVIKATATLDIPSLVDGGGNTQTVTVVGAKLGDFARAAFGVNLQGMTVTAYVSAADTVTIRVQNESTATVDLASSTVNILVEGF